MAHVRLSGQLRMCGYVHCLFYVNPRKLVFWPGCPDLFIGSPWWLLYVSTACWRWLSFNVVHESAQSAEVHRDQPGLCTRVLLFLSARLFKIFYSRFLFWEWSFATIIAFYMYNGRTQYDAVWCSGMHPGGKLFTACTVQVFLYNWSTIPNVITMRSYNSQIYSWLVPANHY